MIKDAGVIGSDVPWPYGQSSLGHLSLIHRHTRSFRITSTIRLSVKVMRYINTTSEMHLNNWIRS